MAITLQTVAVTSARRVRLVYDNTLALGAFSTAWFSIASVDDVGMAPGVSYALAVPGLGHIVELALSLDLVPGARYSVSAVAGVPAADASTAPEVSYEFVVPSRRADPSVGVTANDIAAEIFGLDLRHDGNDFVESADGDLAVVSGPENAQLAVTRRLLSDGLPYDATYGGQARKYVDAPNAALPALRARLEREARADDRVVAASVEMAADENTGDVELHGNVTLVGNLQREIKEPI
jgi:hypothetical protein